MRTVVAKLMSDLDLQIRQLQGQTMPDLSNSSEARIMPMLEEYGRDVVSGRRFNKTMKDFSGRMNEVTKLMGEQPLSQIDQNEQFATIMPNILDVAGMGAMVAGSRAKNANIEMLNIAREADEKGMSKAKIFDATGWWKGKDKRWRFEIDDSASKYTPDIYDQRVGKSFDHDSLYSNYDDISDFQLKKEMRESLPYRSVPEGSYDNGVVTLKDSLGSKSGRSTISHELQHGVQHKEGFARGGSPVQFQIAKENAEYMISGYNARMHDVVKNMDELKASPRYYSDTGKKEYKEMKGAYDRLMNLRNSYVNPAQADPYDSYRALAGEVEARNVQTRLMFDPDQRRMLAPWKTEDVPFDEQIVRYGKGESLSRNGKKIMPDMGKQTAK